MVPIFSKDGYEIIWYLSIVADVLETALFARKNAVSRTSATIERYRIISYPSLAWARRGNARGSTAIGAAAGVGTCRRAGSRPRAR
jgi:hypothetical protein